MTSVAETPSQFSSLASTDLSCSVPDAQPDALAPPQNVDLSSDISPPIGLNPQSQALPSQSDTNLPTSDNHPPQAALTSTAPTSLNPAPADVSNDLSELQNPLEVHSKASDVPDNLHEIPDNPSHPDKPSVFPPLNGIPPSLTNGTCKTSASTNDTNCDNHASSPTLPSAVNGSSEHHETLEPVVPVAPTAPRTIVRPSRIVPPRAIDRSLVRPSGIQPPRITVDTKRSIDPPQLMSPQHTTNATTPSRPTGIPRFTMPSYSCPSGSRMPPGTSTSVPPSPSAFTSGSAPQMNRKVIPREKEEEIEIEVVMRPSSGRRHRRVDEGDSLKRRTKSSTRVRPSSQSVELPGDDAEAEERRRERRESRRSSKRASSARPDSLMTASSIITTDSEEVSGRRHRHRKHRHRSHRKQRSTHEEEEVVRFSPVGSVSGKSNCSAQSSSRPMITAKINTFKNIDHKPGGGQVKIFDEKLKVDADSKIGSKANIHYKPGGGEVVIHNEELEFKKKAAPKVQTLNKDYKPTGGDKKIETRKLAWDVTPKVGSLKNAKHKPLGGDVKIFTEKPTWETASKIQSLANVKHRPGGGDKQIESYKVDFKERANAKINALNHSYDPSETSSSVKIYTENLPWLRYNKPNLTEIEFDRIKKKEYIDWKQRRYDASLAREHVAYMRSLRESEEGDGGREDHREEEEDGGKPLRVVNGYPEEHEPDKQNGRK